MMNILKYVMATAIDCWILACDFDTCSRYLEKNYMSVIYFYGKNDIL